MTSGNKLSKFWQSYKYRFVPWLALNFRNRTGRRVDGGRQDKVVSDEEALRQVTALTRALVAALSRPLGGPYLHRHLTEQHPQEGVKERIGDGSGMRERDVEKGISHDVSGVLASRDILNNNATKNELDWREKQNSRLGKSPDDCAEISTNTENSNTILSPRIENASTGLFSGIENTNTRISPGVESSNAKLSPGIENASIRLSPEVENVNTAQETANTSQLAAVSYTGRLHSKLIQKSIDATPAPDATPSGEDVDPYDLCLLPPMPSSSTHEQAQQVLQATQGFRVECCPSTVGGTGVRVTDVINREVLPPGMVVGIYPGTLYLPQQQAVMLQSLANPFLFRCFDGLLLDGNNRGISKMLFRSCAGRDRVGPCPTADVTWLTALPSNPLSVGQFVNNRSKSNPANVAYQEITVHPGTFSLPERAYLPTLWYSPPPFTPLLDVPFRLLVLVTIKDVAAGEELFSEYFTIITDSADNPAP